MEESGKIRSESERLAEILSELSSVQLRFVVARVETRSDPEACKAINLSYHTVKNWPEKQLINEAVRLMVHDGVITALEIRRRNLAKAMAVKAQGLESVDEKIRQAAATEIIEWELGKATQRNESKLAGEVNLIWDIPLPGKQSD